MSDDDDILNTPYKITWNDNTTDTKVYNSGYLGDCSSCKSKNVSIEIEYNATYNENLKRKICKVCHAKALDRIFGVEQNAYMEDKMYGEDK